jgi:hypothetical protein
MDPSPLGIQSKTDYLRGGHKLAAAYYGNPTIPIAWRQAWPRRRPFRQSACQEIRVVAEGDCPGVPAGAGRNQGTSRRLFRQIMQGCDAGKFLMYNRTIAFLALLFTALSLIPAGAHLFALPNKIALPRDAYFAAQGIYAGWAFLGVLLILALVADGALAVALRSQRPAFLYALSGTFCFVLVLAIFFLVVFPANQATANWTQAPDNWQALRRHWEYGHAVNTGLTLLAFCCVALSVLSAPKPRA